jgi:mannose-6-phosphate isomerase-like protein (cupin superfamily)
LVSQSRIFSAAGKKSWGAVWLEVRMTPFVTRVIAEKPDAMAPDGSEVRLPAGAVSKAVAHRTVEEVWFFTAGRGEMWRQSGKGEETVAVHAGVSIAIPLGAVFQFRATGDSPLEAVAVTMPPWPGMDEATPAEGVWEATA